MIEEERREQFRVGEEIMQFLVKRETSLADALDALTTLLLHQLSAKHGRREEFFRFYEQVSKFLGSAMRSTSSFGNGQKVTGGVCANCFAAAGRAS